MTVVVTDPQRDTTPPTANGVTPLTPRGFPLRLRVNRRPLIALTVVTASVLTLAAPAGAATPPPPPRTPSKRAALLMMASFPPFALAMIGAPDGPCADVATMVGLFLALGLNLKRPVSMARTLVKAHGVAAVAFTIDAARTAQPLRFAGTLACVALIRWMLSLQPPAHGAPGPA